MSVISKHRNEVRAKHLKMLSDAYFDGVLDNAAELEARCGTDEDRFDLIVLRLQYEAIRDNVIPFADGNTYGLAYVGSVYDEDGPHGATLREHLSRAMANAMEAQRSAIVLGAAWHSVTFTRSASVAAAHTIEAHE